MVCKRSSLNGILEGPSERSLEAAIRSTQEKDGRLEHVEEMLEKWIKSQDYLPNNYDRIFARNFIRGAKCNLEAVKRKFEGYFLAKHAFPQYYTDRNPAAPEILKAMEQVNIIFLPKLNEEGDRISVMSLVRKDAADCNIEAVVKLFLMIYDLLLTCDCPYASEIVVFDCTNFSTSHFAKFIGPAMKHVLNIVKDGYAIRMKEIHIYNASILIERLLVAIKPFVHEKVRKRFRMHQTTESLLEAVPAKLLPSDLGGHLDSTREIMMKYKELLLNNADYLQEQETIKLKGKPTKRLEKFNSERLEGTFRKLSID